MDCLENIRVVGLGQACVDYLGRIPLYPHEDQKVELLDVQQQCGGPASTALVTLARLGVRTSFLGSISDDAFGLKIVEGLKKENIDFRFLKITPGYTSQFAFIAISKRGGHRTIFWHRGSVPPLKPHDIDISPFCNAEILHLDGLMIEASIAAACQAKELGIKVVMDAGTMREGSRELVALTEVLIASERFPGPLVGENASPEKALRALHSLGPKVVVITMGERGSVGWDGANLIWQKAFPVGAVDTTGAGDVYHGAYIYGLLQGWKMAECMRLASAASAIKCKAIGARSGIPGLKEIEAFLSMFPDM